MYFDHHNHLLYLTGAVVVPKFLTSQLVFLGYLFTIVLIVAHYNGNLKAATLVPKVAPKYTSLNDLAADGGTTIVLTESTAIRATLEVRYEDLYIQFHNIVFSLCCITHLSACTGVFNSANVLFPSV